MNRRNVTQDLIQTIEDGGLELEHREDVVCDLLSREVIGVDTYGESLHTNNGRNAHIDLYEELLDALQYAHQIYLEDGLDLREPVASAINELIEQSLESDCGYLSE